MNAVNTALFIMEKVGSSTLLNVTKNAGFPAHRIHANNLDQFDIHSFRYIISSVREPMARNVSAKFEFGRQEVHDDRPMNWFDEFIHPILGIDVYAKAFNRKRGWQLYETKQHRLLVVRLEDFDQVLPAALGALYEVEPERFEVLHVRRGVEADGWGEAYRQYLETIRFDEYYLDEIYASKYAKHFYTKKELEGFKQRWMFGQDE